MFAELVLYIEETRQDEETPPIFKLTELAQLYKSRIEQLKVKVDTRINTTRLREMILAEFPDMQSYKKGSDVLMAFEDIGAALAKAYEQDSDKDAAQYVLHKLSSVRYLVRPNHLMVSLKDAKRTLCHSCCLS